MNYKAYSKEMLLRELPVLKASRAMALEKIARLDKEIKEIEEYLNKFKPL